MNGIRNIAREIKMGLTHDDSAATKLTSLAHAQLGQIETRLVLADSKLVFKQATSLPGSGPKGILMT